MSLLSSHVAFPREGHLEAAHSVFKECDWSEFYWDAKEAIPMIAPEPQEKEVDICSLWTMTMQGTESLAGLGVVS